MQRTPSNRRSRSRSAYEKRIRAETAVAYISVIARHEAIRLSEERDRQRSLDQPLLATGRGNRHDVLADRRRSDVDAVIDTLAALRDAKPDHARALMARTLGWRYAEICEAFGWSYTKTNRCVTEGRAALRAAAGSYDDPQLSEGTPALASR
jgi:DNA-directed RNA polymerase specialized sigma24 family protein